jgi:template-activating factor I
LSSKQKKRKLPITFFTWLLENGDASADDIAEVIKDDLWPNPLQYFLYSDLDQTGVDEDSDENDDDDQVVVIEEDDDVDAEGDVEDEEGYDDNDDEDDEEGVEEEDAEDD